MTFRGQGGVFRKNGWFHWIPWPQKTLKIGIIYYSDIFSFLGNLIIHAYFFDPWAEKAAGYRGLAIFSDIGTLSAY